MGMKFLNKKGWHTGSLRNIENVWKAEQKHDAEQKKLDELRLQIVQEREKSEFRALQEQAGLVPKQERLEFLYDSGLSVGKGGASSDAAGGGVVFKEPEPKPEKQESSVPGSLFEEKPQSANDTWRKLHSDPLLLIRQREQEALARLKNNPVQMALIRKSVQEKQKEKDGDKKERRKKHHRHSSSKHHKHSSSKHYSESDDDGTGEDHRKKSSSQKNSTSHEKHHERARAELKDESKKDESDRNIRHNDRYRGRSPNEPSESRSSKIYDRDGRNRSFEGSNHEKYMSRGRIGSDSSKREREYGSSDSSKREKENGNSSPGFQRGKNGNSNNYSSTSVQRESQYKRRGNTSKLTEEERAARLRQMQMDAEVHEEQRWKRLKKAEEDDAREAKNGIVSGSKNFLDAAHKSVYGAEKGGSSTIEQSVRRRTHYLQGKSEAEGNAFRR